MNYTDLKATVQSVIRTNGNNEITGALLQSVLLSIINSFGAGYQFAGIATPSTAPGTPDQKIFYLAGGGTYPNFNSAVISNGDIGVFWYDTAWHNNVIPINRLAVFNLNDPTDITIGYPVQSTGQISPSASYRTSRYMPVATSLQYFSNNTNRIHCYDGNYNHLGYVARDAALLEGTKFVRIFWSASATTIPYFVSEDDVSIRSRYREKDNTPFDVKNLLSTGGIIKLLTAFQKSFFQTTKRQFVNLSSAVVGQVYSQSLSAGASYTYEIIDVNPGDVFLLTTKNTTASAKSYAILDGDNVVLEVYQPAIADKIIFIPENGAKLICNTGVTGGAYSLIQVGGKDFITPEELNESIAARQLFPTVPTIRNGSGGNTSNLNAITTAWMPTNGATIVACATTRPNDENCEYRFGFGLSSSRSDIGTTLNYASAAGHIMHTDYGVNSDKYGVANFPNYTNAVAINFSIAEYNTVTGAWRPLRITDFEGYAIFIVAQSWLVQIAQSGIEPGVHEVLANLGMVERNAERIIDLFAACRYQKIQTAPYKDVQFLICTDSHGDQVAVSNAVEAANGFESVDFFVHNGDIMSSYYSQPQVNAFQTRFNGLTKPGFVVCGNHDVGNTWNVAICCTHEQAYTAYIKPMVDKGYLISGDYQVGKPYWKHDISDYKVRLIGLYEYDDALDLADNNYWEPIAYDSTAAQLQMGHNYAVGDIVNCGIYTDYSFRCKAAVTTESSIYVQTDTVPCYRVRRGFRVIRQTQAQWFLDTLFATPAGYGVIVMMHSAFSDLATGVECRFCQPDYWGRTAEAQAQNYMESDFVAEALKAFVNKSSFNMNVIMKGEAAYMNGNGGYAYNVQKNFANIAADGLWGIMGGHAHRDLIWLKNGIYQVCPVCAITEITNSRVSDIRRSQVDGLAKDSLTVASFANGRIGLCKLGVNISEDGVFRNVEAIKTE